MRIIKSLSVLVSLALVCASSKYMNASATEYYRLVDNDPIASGYTYYFSSNMQYYSGLAYSYNNDMRCSSLLTSQTSASTQWNYPQISLNSTTKITLGVYLYNSNFTDPGTKYSVKNGILSYQQVGTINQNTAYPGWNTIVYTAPLGNFSTTGTKAESSGVSYVQMGSDAIRVSISN